MVCSGQQVNIIVNIVYLYKQFDGLILKYYCLTFMFFHVLQKKAVVHAYTILKSEGE